MSCHRYKENLGEAKAFGIKKGFSNGLSMGFVWMVIFGSYALGFWYGGKLTRDEPDNYTVGKMLIVSEFMSACPCHHCTVVL